MADFAPAPPDVAGRDVTAVIGRRSAAWVLDLLLYAAFSLGVFALLASYVEIPDSVGSLDACDLLELRDETEAAACIELGDRAYITSEQDNAAQLLASVGYLALFVLLQGAGASPGKFLLGLRVVDEQGRRAGVGKSLVRTLLWVVDGAPWVLPVVGFVVGLTSTGHRRVGDMVAKTYVVRAADLGSPVLPPGAAPPPGEATWGAPPPSPSAWSPRGAGSPAPPEGAASPSSAEVDALVPEISGIPADAPAPPPVLADEPPTWEPPDLEDPTPPELRDPPSPPEPDDTAPPIAEAHEAADISTPVVDPDPSWWSGPESGTPGGDPDLTGAQVPEDVGIPEWADAGGTDGSGETWEPPTTPTSDMDPVADPSPTAGPAPLTAPGADPVTDAPAAPEEPSLPPPQWDDARNTYIQWDPRIQQWLQWDPLAERWDPIRG